MTVIQTIEPFFEILCDDDSNFACNRVISHLLARQKEEAMGSITEVVQTVKDPKSIIRGKNDDDTATILHEEPEKLNHDFVLPKSVEPVNATTIPGRQTPLKFQGDNNMSRFSSYEERNKSSRKSGITPLKGYFVYYLLFKFDP